MVYHIFIISIVFILPVTSYRRRRCVDGEALVFSVQRYVIVGSTTPPAGDDPFSPHSLSQHFPPSFLTRFFLLPFPICMQLDTLRRIIERGGGSADIVNTITELNSEQNTDDGEVQRKITAIIKAGMTTSVAEASSSFKSSPTLSSSSSSSSSSSLIPMLPPSFLLDAVCTVDSDMCNMIERCCAEFWNSSTEVTDDSTTGQNSENAKSKRKSTSKTKQKGKKCKL